MSAFDRYDPQIKPWFEWLYAAIQRYDRSARVTSTVRSSAEQARLYRRYVAGQSKYPVAPPGRSKHESGRAIDIYASDQALRWIGEYWEKLGPTFRWGGRFNDNIHFEL